MMHALRRGHVLAALEVLIHRLREERYDRGQELRQRGQNGVERVVGGLLIRVALAPAPPEAAPAAANVPVTQFVVDELLGGQDEGGEVVLLESAARLSDQQLEVGKDPAVEVGET